MNSWMRRGAGWAVLGWWCFLAGAVVTGSRGSEAGAKGRVAAGAVAEIEQREGNSLRGRIGHVPFVVLRGTVEERGEAYGVLCGRDVRDLLDGVLIPVINARDKEGWRTLSAMVEERFRFPEEMLRQMEAFMRGFRREARPEERMLALGRELTVADLKVLQAFADLASARAIHFGGCSSFSAWGALTTDREVITGRNLDYTSFPGRLPLMLIAQEPAEPGRLKWLEISLAGVFGASTALNEAGVMISLHDEPGLAGEAEGGWVPRIWPLREAIETARGANAVETALEHLRGKALAMGANVHVSFPADEEGRTPVIVEWDGNAEGEGVTVRGAANGSAPAIFCTNHYLKRGNGRGVVEGSSAERYAVLEQAAEKRFEQSRVIGTEAAMEMMSRAAVRGAVSTYISVVAVPAERRVLVAFAAAAGESATDSEWVEVKWEEVFNAR